MAAARKEHQPETKRKQPGSQQVNKKTPKNSVWDLVNLPKFGPIYVESISVNCLYQTRVSEFCNMADRGL